MKKSLFCLILAACLLLSGCAELTEELLRPLETLEITETSETAPPTTQPLSEHPALDALPDFTFSYKAVPRFSGKPYVVLNDNLPAFTAENYSTASYETFGARDKLGRCAPVMACVGIDLLPDEKRSDISKVRPTGWQSDTYDFIDGGYLYNRCHLIGFQLSGENANAKNLITGTRYLNVEGMLPFENQVTDYIKETGHHVLYRVSPYFKGKELVARGVEIEAWSVEDDGEGICFHVYCYNVQPDVVIDYATGKNHRKGEEPVTYILNTASMKFHVSTCATAKAIKKINTQTFDGDRSELIAKGYTPCPKCNP